MATEQSKGSQMIDMNAWMDMQRRNLEAFTNASKIVADGVRTVSERQVELVQQAMGNLWGEMQSAGRGGQSSMQPENQIERLRSAFERMVEEVQEMSGVLLKAQGEALSVLNRAATENVGDLGRMAPDFAAMQKAASEAMQTASDQVRTAIEEMRRRMTEVEETARSAMSRSASTGVTAAASATSAAKGSRSASKA
jgi:hypothetical protein